MAKPDITEDMKICCFLWESSRSETEDSTWVMHVCVQPILHHGRHICSCGAKSRPQGAY